MLAALINTARGMNHTVQRESVLTQLDNNLTGINGEIIPAITEMKKYFKEINADIKDYPLLSSVDRVAKLRSKDAADLLSKLVKLFGAFSSAGSSLKSVMMDELPEVITMNTATARQLAVLQVNKDMSMMSLYVLDLLLLVSQNSESAIQMVKMKEKNIRAEVSSFSAMVGAYSGNISKIVKDLPKVANTEVTADSTKFSMMENILKKQGKIINFPTIGFTGNPIYHIRTFFVDAEIAKYETLKDKKKILELKILDLKVKRTGDVDPQLERQIEYYEEKLDKTEYTIRKIENE